MFKYLYNNTVLNLLNFKTKNRSNLYSFLKTSFIIKQYSNFLLYFISINKVLKLKNIQTSFYVFTIDNIYSKCIFLTVIWFLAELFLFIY